MQQHGAIPAKIARLFVADPEDQRDLLQEMQLQLWRSAAQFAGHAKASTWIYRVCLNTASTWRRSEMRRRRLIESVDARDLVPRELPDPRLEELYSAIRQLRPADRALVLLYLDDRSYREIAEILGLSETNTGVRLQRVKQQLAERLGKTTRT